MIVLLLSLDVSEDLVDVVLARASEDDALSAASKDLILRALVGDDLTDSVNAATSSPERDDPEPARAFLASITVSGFRGIGPSSTLPLVPGCGLTVIAGRNGCGKSSFAEALEVASTRGTYRANKRPPLWHEAWRNLHTRETAIRVEFAEEGRGKTLVGVDWAAGDADLADGDSWAQRPGERRERGRDPLGWSAPMETYRPFLSYDDLGALFAEPSRLHDALLPILGLEQLDDARQRLDGAVKQVGEPEAESRRLAKALKPELERSTDERARLALTAINRRPPRVAEVRALIAGSGIDDRGDIARLRALAAARPPERARFEAARDAYAAANTNLAGIRRETDVATEVKRDLLHAALGFHDQNGDGPCPVCDTGRLDEGWAQRVRAELSADRERQEALTAARRTRTAAAEELTAAMAAAPPAFSGDVPAALVREFDDASSAWQVWNPLRTDPAAAADQGAAALEQVEVTTHALVEAAKRELGQREEAWQPLAARLGDWCTQADRAERDRDRLGELQSAFTWLKNNALAIANERFQPFAERTKRIWSLLRQESSVDLGAVTLAGINTRRRVDLTGSVDGADAAPLTVMSNGELHALALALFLPRATAPESPFGFVVIDDPVQAMDPTKVDGLARVLAEAAEVCQVVVLTHDDRLPETVRRLEIPGARLLEVERSSDSRVTVTDMSDPASRYLADARAVATDRAVPAEIVARVVPELCRLALEAACRDRYFRRRLLAGDGRAGVESTWASTNGARGHLQLGLGSEPDASFDRWLQRGRRRQALGICTSAVHAGLHGPAHPAIDAVEELIGAVKDERGR